MGFYGRWPRYVPVGERIEKAKKEIARRQKKGETISPVVIEGRVIARSFWGRSWCENLQRYSDYSNRLPRGSSYVRNGSVVDLKISKGTVNALVSGSRLYTVTIKVAPVPKAQWQSICQDCAGSVDSLVDLLQGRLSKGVMERVCQKRIGLFPQPSEIELDCSCPDWASMCKHVAAALYGVGARLDQQPELLFRLRGVDERELLASAEGPLQLTRKRTASARVLAEDDLSGLFGLDLDSEANPTAAPSRGSKAARKAAPARVGRPAKATTGKVGRPAKATPGKVGRPAKATPGKVGRPAKVTPGKVGRPAKAAPAKVGRPAKATPSKVGRPAKATPGKVGRPAKATPGKVGRPAKVTPASPPKAAPAKVGRPAKATPGKVGRPAKVTPASPPKAAPAKVGRPAKVTPGKVGRPAKATPGKVGRPAKATPGKVGRPAKAISVTTRQVDSTTGARARKKAPAGRKVAATKKTTTAKRSRKP
jgi:uncharacterized Zn finger protein